MTAPALYATLPASLCVRDHSPAKATLSMYWSAAMPLALTLTITSERTEEWLVSRNVFIHAHELWARGAWIGCGDFSLCYAGTQVMFGFKGLIDGQRTNAVVITKSEPVAEFIAHSQRLIPPSTEAEEQAMTLAIDNALQDILNG